MRHLEVLERFTLWRLAPSICWHSAPFFLPSPHYTSLWVCFFWAWHQTRLQGYVIGVSVFFLFLLHWGLSKTKLLIIHELLQLAAILESRSYFSFILAKLLVSQYMDADTETEKREDRERESYNYFIVVSCIYLPPFIEQIWPYTSIKIVKCGKLNHLFPYNTFSRCQFSQPSRISWYRYEKRRFSLKPFDCPFTPPSAAPQCLLLCP